MVTSYIGWTVGDKINICASIDEFCGAQYQFIYANDINVTKYPSVCPVEYGTERGCGLHLSNVELTFKLVSVSESVPARSCIPLITYKTIGSVRTDGDGIAGVTYTVTDQDRANYESSSGTYKVMFCITNSDGQETSSSNISQTTDNINIIPFIPQVSTHYIEYNLNYLPFDFLSWISNQIVSISNTLGQYIPLPAGIYYNHVEFVDSKFRIYLVAATSAGSILSLDIIQTLTGVAKTIAGILLFILAGLVAGITGGLALPVIIVILGASVIAWGIYDIVTSISTPGTMPELTPQQKVETVQEFLDVYVDPAADDLTPQCKCPTPTALCTVDDMLFYVGGRATARYAQCLHAHENKGDATIFCTDAVKNEIESIKSGLSNGIITVQEACTRLENNIVTVVKENVKEVLKIITCNPGYTWNKDTQKCEKICNFPVVGYCFDGAITVGAILLGGYVVYKVVSKR